MSVALLDANVLIALIDPEHQHHDAAHDWLAAHAASGFAVCPWLKTHVCESFASRAIRRRCRFRWFAAACDRYARTPPATFGRTLFH